MQQIVVNNIRLYAYHGCLPEESRIGSEYRCDVDVSADLTTSSYSDKLEDTVDYVSLTRIVREEMQTRSALLEHVARRICERIMAEHGLVKEAKVRVAKLCPPIEADVEDVSVAWILKRKNG